MIEFKELRSGKDMSYYLRRAINYGQWGGFSGRHLYNRSVIDNSMVTVYDYDLKIQMVAISAVFIFFVNRVIFGK